MKKQKKQTKTTTKEVVKGKKKETNTKEVWLFWLKTIGKYVGYAALTVLAVFLLVFVYVNLPVAKKTTVVPVGVTFSQRYAQDIGLDWKQVYIAMLDDLQVKKIRIPVYWDLVEATPGNFDYSDIDWQLQEAQKRNAEIILAVGQKVPRWPECFIPQWANGSDAVRKEALVKFVQQTVMRYKNTPAVERWQIENEPFLDFGICPPAEPALLDREIAAARAIDTTRPIVVTDSGELSLWLQAAKRADVFGTTMYREVYTAKYGHWRYPIGPNFFKLKRLFIELFANQKNAIVVELQGEPWVKGWTVHAPLAEQLASMNGVILSDNIEFAKKTGVEEVYVWGIEWWYWLKLNHNDASVWNTAKEYILQGQQQK